MKTAKLKRANKTWKGLKDDKVIWKFRKIAFFHNESENNFFIMNQKITQNDFIRTNLRFKFVFEKKKITLMRKMLDEITERVSLEQIDKVKDGCHACHRLRTREIIQQLEERVRHQLGQLWIQRRADGRDVREKRGPQWAHWYNESTRERVGGGQPAFLHGLVSSQGAQHCNWIVLGTRHVLMKTWHKTASRRLNTTLNAIYR